MQCDKSYFAVSMSHCVMHTALQSSETRQLFPRMFFLSLYSFVKSVSGLWFGSFSILKKCFTWLFLFYLIFVKKSLMLTQNAVVKLCLPCCDLILAGPSGGIHVGKYHRLISNRKRNQTKTEGKTLSTFSILHLLAITIIYFPSGKAVCACAHSQYNKNIASRGIFK